MHLNEELDVCSNEGCLLGDRTPRSEGQPAFSQQCDEMRLLEERDNVFMCNESWKGLEVETVYCPQDSFMGIGRSSQPGRNGLKQVAFSNN